MLNKCRVMSIRRSFHSSSQSFSLKRLKVDDNFDMGSKREWEIIKNIDKPKSSWFKFSVASYNVLAQNLLETNKHLYKNCPPKHLSWQSRKNALRKELCYYQPDILCLQEVHIQEFSRFFLPMLQKLGYFGLYKKRTHDKEDGCATFFKHNKFYCVASRQLEYHLKGVDALDRDNIGLILLLKPVIPKVPPTLTLSHEPVDKTLHGNPHELTPETKEKLKDFRICVANTHLLFNPKRGDIKLAQLMTLMAGIDDLNGGSKHTVVMCGDFNSHPHSGLFNFLLNGRLDCRDVSIRYFSGQIQPSLDDQAPSFQSFLSPIFLQKVSFLTDQCQFVDVIRRRAERKNLLRNSNRSKKTRYIDEENSSLTDFISWSDSPISYTQGSGVISHNLRLRSSYDHKGYNSGNSNLREITSFIEKSLSTVDYIFYSQTIEEEEGSKIKPSLSELHLLKRLKLLSEAEIRSKLPYIPNSTLGSDHFMLLTEFGVKLG